MPTNVAWRPYAPLPQQLPLLRYLPPNVALRAPGGTNATPEGAPPTNIALPREREVPSEHRTPGTGCDDHGEPDTLTRMGERRLWTVLFLAAFGWGTGSVATRSLLLHGVDPFTLIPIRFAGAAAILAAWLWWRRRLTMDRGIWFAGLILGTANMSAPTVFFTLALEHISAGLGGLLIALIPIVTTVWAHFVLVDEQFTLRKLVGSGVAFSGVALLIATGEAGFTGGSILTGVAWSAVGILLASLGGVLSRFYAQRYSVMELAGPQFVACAMGVLIIWPLLGSTPFASITATSWSLLAYMATLGTVLPYLAFLWVVRHTTATRASLVGYLVPLVSLATGALLLAEQLNLIIGLAAALILVGVVIVDRAEPTRPVEPHGV